MPTIRFTRNIQRHVACPTETVDAGTLADAMAAYFALHAPARGYVLDDRGRLRAHMAAFIDGRQIEDRDRLSDPVASGAVIDIVQALSGG